MSETAWTEDELREIERIETGAPSPPNPRLRYVLTDCFACGFVTVRRKGAPVPERCPGCDRPIHAVVVQQEAA